MNKTIIYILIIVALATIILADPPTLHSINGFIFMADGSQTTGTYWSLNNTNNSGSNAFIQGTTSGPPGYEGYFSTAQLNGSDGDTIILTGWNGTAYEQFTFILNGTMESINNTVNATRNETNVTITYPATNQEISQSTVFNISVNITSIGGGDNINCNVTLTISNQTVLTLGSNINNIGNLAVGTSNITYFQTTASNVGTSNINATSNCVSDTPKLDGIQIHEITNINITDNIAPTINLVTPLNSSKWVTSNTIVFKYNVTDEETSISNCSLIINNQINKTNSSITEGINQSFTIYLSDNTYNWSVNCTDNNNNIGSSTTSNLTLNFVSSIPSIDVLTFDDTDTTNPGIDLYPASTVIVNCSGQVTDINGADDIDIITGIIFDNITSSSTDLENFTKHYTNNSCAKNTINPNSINFECLFNVYFFANPGQWICNITVNDTDNNINTSITNQYMNELIAIDISIGNLDFGNLAIGQNSQTTDYNKTIENEGNIAIDINLDGHASQTGDSDVLQCDQNNISVSYLRFELTPGINWTNKTQFQVSGVDVNINLTEQNQNITSPTNDTIHFGLGIPKSPIVRGQCNGTLLITATIDS